MVSFLGILEGRILPVNLHDGSLYNGSNWIFPFEEDKAFTWKVGEKVRFKIDKAGNYGCILDWSHKGKRMAELISLRANEEGLGPASWWL